jgi:pteridine reductase
MPAHRVALVTGSGRRRLGWHVVQALAERGYAVGVHYRTSQCEADETVAELQSRGAEAMAFCADVANEQQVRGMVDAVLARYGRLDALVNCASIWEKKRLEDVTARDVRRHFEINALGTFLCCQHAGLAMAQQPEGGAIINFGDWAEVRPYVDYAAYFPSKGAVSTLTRSLAVELAARNPRVRVNCILPGPAMLPDDLPPEERQAAIAGTLVRREGTAEPIVKAVLHLIDNHFITGVCLPVDGGRTIHSAS